MNSNLNTFFRAEKWFTALSLLFFTGGIFKLILTGGANQGDDAQFDASIIQAIALVIYTITTTLLLLRWKKVLAFVSKDRWVLLLVFLTLASVLWSSSPDLTIRRSIALIGTSLFGTYFATRYTIREQLTLLGWALGISLLLSLVFIFALPQYGISGAPHTGAWRGIWTHKNGLGRHMAIAANVFWLLGLSIKQRRWIPWTALGLAILSVVMARATGALLASLIPIALIPFLQSLRWRSQFAIPAAIAILAGSGIAAIAITLGSEAILIALGEDATLTGRTEFWPVIIHMIQQQPWLGYGYEAFWTGLNGPSAYIIHATQGHSPNHAHNGILQLWLHLGFLGVIVFLIGFWNMILRSVTWVRLSDSAADFWPLVFCVMMIQFNISESSILEYNNLEWVIYVAVALSIIRLPKIRFAKETPVSLELASMN